MPFDENFKGEQFGRSLTFRIQILTEIPMKAQERVLMDGWSKLIALLAVDRRLINNSIEGRCTPHFGFVRFVCALQATSLEHYEARCGGKSVLVLYSYIG